MARWPKVEPICCRPFRLAAPRFLAGSSKTTRYIEGLNHFVTSMTAPIASGWTPSPGGPLTHWETSPFHGAHAFPPLLGERKKGLERAAGCRSPFLAEQLLPTHDGYTERPYIPSNFIDARTPIFQLDFCKSFVSFPRILSIEFTKIAGVYLYDIR